MAKKDRILDIQVDTKKVTSLQNKLAKYGPYAIQEGLKAASEYLNTDEFKLSMYPEDQSGEPFEFSTDKQRKAWFASDGFGGGVPHVRTYELMREGVFSIDERNLFIEYVNAPYTKWVIHPEYQIIGHKKRGWQPVNRFVVAQSKHIAKIFQDAAKEAWEKMEKFMFGGGGGL